MRLFGVAISLCLAVLALVGCGASSHEHLNPKKITQIRIRSVYLGKQPVTLHVENPGEVRRIVDAFNGLKVVNPKGNHICPAIAGPGATFTFLMPDGSPVARATFLVGGRVSATCNPVKLFRGGSETKLGGQPRFAAHVEQILGSSLTPRSS